MEAATKILNFTRIAGKWVGVVEYVMDRINLYDAYDNCNYYEAVWGEELYNYLTSLQKLKMCFYDFLFYASYKQGIKSRNYHDIPILGGILAVSFCLLMNVITMWIIMGKLFDFHLKFNQVSKTIFAVVWVALLYFYYSYNGRYRTIIEKYDRKKEYIRFYNMPYVLVIFMHMGIAIMLFVLFAFIIPW